MKKRRFICQFEVAKKKLLRFSFQQYHICATNNWTLRFFSPCMEISLHVQRACRSCVGAKCWQQLQKSGHVTVLTGRRRKKSEWRSERERVREWVRASACSSAPPHHGALLRPCSSLPLRDQQAGAHPQRPAGIHEVEPERLHPALHLVSRSAGGSPGEFSAASRSRSAARARELRFGSERTFSDCNQEGNASKSIL